MLDCLFEVVLSSRIEDCANGDELPMVQGTRYRVVHVGYWCL